MTLFSNLRHSPWAVPVAALAALAMLVISETSHWRSREALDELSELSTARVRVQRLLLSVTDAETAQRGYLLTGRKEYLEPYNKALERLPVTLTWLREHYRGSGALTVSMAELDKLVAEKLAELSETLRLEEIGRHDAAHDVVLTNIGKERMDTIRATAEKMLVDEAKGGQQAREKVSDSLLVNRLGVSTMTALSLLGLFMYLRQTRALTELRRQQQLAVRAERDLLEIEVQRRTAELTELSRHLLTAREDERNRLARDLHDELGALLTAAKLDVARLKMRMVTPSPEAAERLTHLNEMLNSGIALKRRIIEDLRPSSLGNLGLVAALEILVRDFERGSELKVTSSLQAVDLSPASELTVYRLVQEALTNINKYARASTVRVALSAEESVAKIEVTDNGVGFDIAARKTAAHGLLGMRYRVEAEGGTLLLQSALGRGTRIGATLPLSAPSYT